jgi:hypothetical protein
MAIDQLLEVNLEDLDWRFPILEWLVEGKLPSNQTEARRITSEPKLSFSSTVSSTSKGLPAYSCGASSEIKTVSYYKRYMPTPGGHHAGPRTLVGKAFRQVFYWPTAVADLKNIVRRCEGCQFYAR